MEVDNTAGPSRIDVETQWAALTAGSTNREAVHSWAARWVEGQAATIEDPMVWSALIRLHGFDLTASPDAPNVVTHGGQGRYVHSEAHIMRELARWRLACREYDANPAAWLRRVRDRAERYRPS